MTPKQRLIAIVALTGAAAGGYWLGQGAVHDMGSSAPASSSGSMKAGDVDPKTGKRVLYWHDPMVPGQKFDKPGKSPFMDMQLVPVYAEDGQGDEAATAVAVSGSVRQSLGIRTAPVEAGSLDAQVSAVGTVVANERGEAVLQARTAGFVDRLYVRAALDPVRRGQTLVTITAPQWAAAQEEYLALRRSGVPGVAALADAARQRMRLAGMSEAQIAAVARTGRTQLSLAVAAPASGIVTELMVREGMAVTPGQTLARIASLDPIWIDVAVPERESGLVRVGTGARIETASLPGETVPGRVLALLPKVDPETRTRMVRVQANNPRQRLVPGMTASVSFLGRDGREALLVPTEAVIRTGTRTIVFVDQGKGRYAPVNVTVGRESGGRTEVLAGLTTKDRVVTSGQFLIDSEASLRGVEARNAAVPQAGAREGSPRAAAPEAVKPGPKEIEATGVVESVKPGQITLSHEPIPELNWPSMTMSFPTQDPMPKSVQPGTHVRFNLFLNPARGPVITTVTPTGGNR